jgi:sentrin-specific protease 1
MVDLYEVRKIQSLLQLPSKQVVIHGFKISLTVEEISSLIKENWLYDNVINFYLQLICKRNYERLDAGYPKVAAVSTFWYTQLVSRGFSDVKRWTKKTNIFDQDLVFIPIHHHLENHWCLAVINVTDKRVCYYDSLHARNDKCLRVLRDFLILEHCDKKQKSLTISEWKFSCVEDSPYQRNGHDYGVFTCITAEYLSRKAPLNFSQEDMPYFRRRMLLQMLVYKNLDC